MPHKLTSRWWAVMLAAAVSLLLVGSALAAHPKAGKSYTGFTSAPAVHGYKQPVSFKVSRNGRRLLGFKYVSRCDGIGGFGGPGDPWTNPVFAIRVGTINVGSTGKFSVKNVKSTVNDGGVNKVTTSNVAGRFKTARKAIGTIRFTQREGTGKATCKLTFTATTR